MLQRSISRAELKVPCQRRPAVPSRPGRNGAVQVQAVAVPRKSPAAGPRSNAGLSVSTNATATPPATAPEVREKKAPPPIFTTTSLTSVDMYDEDECAAFVDRDGNFLEVMCCDYGFRSGAARMYSKTQDDGTIPGNAFQLAWRNFQAELRALRQSFRFDEYGSISEVNPPRSPLGKAGYQLGQSVVDAVGAFDRTLERNNLLEKLLPRPDAAIIASKKMVDEGGPDAVLGECREIRARLKQLKLSNKAVWDREHAREAAGRGVNAPWYVRGVYLSLCLLLDVLYDNRPIQRFWFLETVARMPYFSYISILHLYESLGWWRAGAELRKVHFAEEWNELHHLQIMESLGGDKLWFDRFAAQHAAVVYYWILLLLYVFSPQLAYNFSELIEYHAVDTYGEFVDENVELLKSLPPPLVAAAYYRGNDLYTFDDFQTSQLSEEPRRPSCNTLYDVFSNIRDDELEHVKTMKACQDYSVVDDLQRRRDRPRNT